VSKYFLLEKSKQIVMHNKESLVSIGCPTYNRPEGLRQVLKCLLDQTHSNLEIIVSDNHSLGVETEKIVRDLMKQDSRIKYFRQEQNIGPFNNYKFLLEAARGDYFAWLCDDDARSQTFVEACLAEFDRLKTPIVVNSYSRRVDKQSGQTIAIDRGCNTMGLPAYQRYIKYISTIYTQQAAVTDINYGVMRRDCLLAAMQDVPNVAGWDHLLLARLALDGEFYTIPTELMESAIAGLSANSANVVKAHKIQGSLSATKPVWVRETYQQQTIRNSPHLARLEKIGLSIWSYIYYFLSHGMKMWVKGLFPELFTLVKSLSQHSQKLLN
jgi:glycosyltransferase involved in cell wall biosynthesis